MSKKYNFIYKTTNVLNDKYYDKTQRKPTYFSRWMNLANNFV